MWTLTLFLLKCKMTMKKILKCFLFYEKRVINGTTCRTFIYIYKKKESFYIFVAQCRNLWLFIYYEKETEWKHQFITCAWRLNISFKKGNLSLSLYICIERGSTWQVHLFSINVSDIWFCAVALNQMPHFIFVQLILGTSHSFARYSR